jgi:hypothetical protein
VSNKYAFEIETESYCDGCDRKDETIEQKHERIAELEADNTERCFACGEWRTGVIDGCPRLDCNVFITNTRAPSAEEQGE